MRADRRTQRFTLLELLIVLAVVALLLVILLPVLKRGRDRSQEVACINHLANLSRGIHLFQCDHQCYPLNFLRDDLSDLAPAERGIFQCPATHMPYELYYVPREPGTDAGYVLGCPYHCIVAAALGKGVKKFYFGTVKHDGREIAAGEEVEGGTLTFEDGTTVSLSGKVLVVTSFRTEIHRLHTILRVFEDYGAVTVTVNAATGTKFEVVTPAANVVVAGTEFSVHTAVSGGNEVSTAVNVTSGRVEVNGPNCPPVVLTAASPTWTVVGPSRAAHRLPLDWLPGGGDEGDDDDDAQGGDTCPEAMTANVAWSAGSARR